MTERSHTREIIIAADEMIARHGDRAAIVAAGWAVSAHDRGDIAKHEFWQRVCVDLNERSYQKARARKQLKAGEALMDRYSDVFTALAN